MWHITNYWIICPKKIRVYSADENIVNGDIGYINGEAEYSPEQTSYMPVVMDSYDDSNAEIIKNAVNEFLEREREMKQLFSLKRKEWPKKIDMQKRWMP